MSLSLVGRVAGVVGGCLWALVALAQGADPSSSAGYSTEDVRIAANGYSLAATILKPQGDGPFGAVVLNHGFAATAEERAAQSWLPYRAAAAAFVDRGYVVVLPSRRGFGRTGGELAEEPGPCWWPRFGRAEQKAADDVMATWVYTRRLPYVDPARLILAGQSAGGLTAVFTAAMRAPKGLVAVLSFAAGRGAQVNSDGVPCAVEPVAELMEELGARIKVPVLFQYAENDRYFGPQVSRLWFDRFHAAVHDRAASSQYVLQPATGRNGHFLFTATAGLQLWLPVVEKFLNGNGVRFAQVRHDEAPAARQVAGLPQ